MDKSELTQIMKYNLEETAHRMLALADRLSDIGDFPTADDKELIKFAMLWHIRGVFKEIEVFYLTGQSEEIENCFNYLQEVM